MYIKCINFNFYKCQKLFCSNVVVLFHFRKVHFLFLFCHSTYNFLINYIKKKTIFYCILISFFNFIFFILGAVYVLGDYKDGRLGMDIAETQKVPKVLSSLPQIKLATCGSDNSFVVTENSNYSL